MKTITNIFVLLIFCMTISTTSARHIVGGTSTYKVTGFNNQNALVDVVFNLYRDASSTTDFDDDINIGVYGFRNGNYEVLFSLLTTLSFTSEIQFSGEGDCPGDLFNYLIGIYTFQVNLPLSGYDHYTIAYQRCCRDNSLTNILTPQESGIALSLDIYPKAFDYSEQIAVSAKPFPRITEVGQNIQFDLGLDDSYTKEYFLTAPEAAGGIAGSGSPGNPNDCDGIIPNPFDCLPDFDQVQYIDPNNPYGQGAVLELGKDDGILSMNIPMISKVLIGVTVDRFIDGEITSTVRQQFVTNSLTCGPVNTIDEKESILEVWPMPSNNYLYFSAPLKNITIYNSNAQSTPINTPSKDQFTSEININNLSGGIYILRAQNNEGKWISKRVIKLN